MPDEKATNILEKLQEDIEQDVMGIIYEKVNALLGAGDQLFTMEYPARGLDMKTYEYSIDDCYSTLTKPYPVQEAEFLLSDQMFDVAPIVQGSNGERVSVVFDTISNNFVPKLDTLQTFMKDKEHLRGGLDADVEHTVDGEKKKVSSPAEILESTKQKMRSSLRRSLDGSTDIYPVQFQPSDWFKSLKPNISPKDLTMATESLLADYKSKQARLRRLQMQFNELSVVEIRQEEQDKLKNDISKLQQEVNKADRELMQTYGAGAVSAVKAVMDIYKEVADPAEQAQKAMDAVNAANAAAKDATDGSKKLEGINGKIYNIIGNVADGAVKGIIETYTGQQELLSKLGNLTQTQAAYAESRVKDMRLQRIRIQEQIDSVQADLEFLRPLVSGTIAEIAKAEKADGDLMVGGGSDDTDFVDIIIKSEEIASSIKNSSSSEASSSGFNVGGWFLSAGKRSTSSSGERQGAEKKLERNVEIGFRVKKVTFDRGGWFNPNVLKMSNNYFRLTETRFSKGITKADVKKQMELGKDLKDLVTYKDTEKDLNYVMPSFPTGFVIAKDVTVRISINQGESTNEMKFDEKSSSSGGGFLGFSAKSSNSSSSSSESAYVGSTEKFTYIRIPGPQILGWFQQFTPADNSDNYKALGEGTVDNKILKP